MSKRVANCRPKSDRRKTARYGRIRIGWRKARMLAQLDKIQDAADLKKLDEDQKSGFEAYKERVKAVIPKALLRRHQAR